MKIAIVGSGISGLVVAEALHQQHDIHVFESEPRLGGHTDTHAIKVENNSYTVDSGFIVFNEQNYPGFTHLLAKYGVESQPTEMSFAVVNEKTGLQYNASSLRGLFSQKRNLIRRSYWKMLADIRRFYQQAPELLQKPDDGVSLYDYLRSEGYCKSFIEDHILPMACALWSADRQTIAEYPAHYFVAFMHNHQMLQLNNRPQWRVVKGGSCSYVKAITESFSDRISTSCPVTKVTRHQRGVTLEHAQGVDEFDCVFFACHSDQALRLLQDPTPREQAVLSAIKYQTNRMVLHSDTRHMPCKRRDWASWNALIPKRDPTACTVSYSMNILQRLPRNAPDFIVTLNPPETIPPEKIYATRTYAHPVYTRATLWAQKRHHTISGINGTFYCGAYWGWGFHEDGVRSAQTVLQQFTTWQEQHATKQIV